MPYPIKCHECGSSNFPYRSDRSGNVRRYNCKDCGAVFIATIKGLVSDSAVSEPHNLKDEALHWAKVVKSETST